MGYRLSCIIILLWADVSKFQIMESSEFFCAIVTGCTAHVSMPLRNTHIDERSYTICHVHIPSIAVKETKTSHPRPGTHSLLHI